MRRLRLCTALAICVAALVGCSPGGPSLDLVTRVQPLWTVQAALVGSPSAAEGVVVSYVDAGVDALQVVAWAADSGAELWRDSASLGSVPGYGVNSAEIVEVDGAPLVAYLQDVPDDDRGWQRVAVAELETGRRLDDGSLIVDATTLPSGCDAEPGVCLRGRAIERSESRAQLMRADLDADRLLAERGPTLPDNSRFLGGHVYSTLDRAPDGVEMLGYASDGVVLWERPYSEVFGPGYSSDGGWSWLDDDRRVVIGTSSVYDPATANGSVATYDLAAGMTVGLDPDSGETLWRVNGADRWCDAAELDSSLITEVVPVCLFSGGTTTVDRSDPDNPSLHVSGVEARIVGLDAETGAELWSVDAGRDPSLVRDWTSSFVSTIGPRPVTIGDGPVLLNVLTGRSSAIAPRAVLACQSEREFFRANRPGTHTPEPARYSGGFGVFPCDGDRRRSDEGFSPGALEMAATKAGGGWFVVGGSDALSGFRPSAP